MDQKIVIICEAALFQTIEENLETCRKSLPLTPYNNPHSLQNPLLHYKRLKLLPLHLGFSAKLRIWQVSACKMEPRSGIIS